MTVNFQSYFIGVFALLQAYSALLFIKYNSAGVNLGRLFLFATVGAAGVVFLVVVVLTYAGINK